MAKNSGIGKTGVILAVIISFVMCLCSYLFSVQKEISGNFGICLPSPDLWKIDPLLSWLINIVLIAVATIGAAALNHSYNFIRTTEPVFQVMAMVLVCCNPSITFELSSSVIILVVNLLCLAFIFRAYASPNATQDMFAIATFLGIGSMFQYAFIPFIAAYLLMAIVIKVMRLKEFLAFIMGLVAPYWVGLGFGLISIENFQFPQIVNLFSEYENATELFLLLASTATVILLGIMIGLTDSVRLYAGNSKVNALNFCISILGIITIVCVILDFNNMLAYLATLYLALAAQLANICALWNIRKKWLVTAIPSFIFIGFFIAMIIV